VVSQNIFGFDVSLYERAYGKKKHEKDYERAYKIQDFGKYPADFAFWFDKSGCVRQFKINLPAMFLFI